MYVPYILKNRESKPNSNQIPHIDKYNIAISINQLSIK